MSESIRGATPPDTIEIEGEQMVQQIVPRRNLREHPLDTRTRFALVVRALGPRARSRPVRCSA